VSQTIDVAYVAELARLALTPEEAKSFQKQLENIVHYVEKIAQLDVTIRETALSNAPARNNYEVKLPKIVEDA
jgi:aspartyl-tRNA(Asn)/glutamyl-tRNA(Gln) amidotransferase subunit C